MDESIAERAASFAAEAAVARLTDDEVVQFSLAVLLGYDGRSLPYAEKVRGLYTQEGGRLMHDVTKQAVEAALVERNPRLAGSPD